MFSVHQPSQTQLFAAIFVLALASRCHCRFTPADAPAPLQQAPTGPAAPKQTTTPQIDAAVVNVDFAHGLCGGCVPTIDACISGDPVCVDTSSHTDTKLPCERVGPTETPGSDAAAVGVVEPTGAAVFPKDGSVAGTANDGGVAAPAWQTHLRNTTNQPRDIQQANQQDGSDGTMSRAVAEKAQGVIGQCPKDKPTRMCCVVKVLDTGIEIDPAEAGNVSNSSLQQDTPGPAANNTIPQPLGQTKQTSAAGASTVAYTVLSVVCSGVLVLMQLSR